MTSPNLRTLTDEQLSLSLLDQEKHLFRLRFQSATARLETPSEIRKARKTIARIKTETRRRELDALKQASHVDLIRAVKFLEQGSVETLGKRRTHRALSRLRTMIHKTKTGRIKAKSSQR